MLWIKHVALNKIYYYFGGNVHDKIQVRVGRNIRRFRLNGGLTLEELAERAQLHPNYLGEVERGKVNLTLSNIKKVADALRKPPADLLKGTRGPAPAGTGTAPTTNVLTFSPKREKDLFNLVKALKAMPSRERKRIIRIAKSLNNEFK